MKASSFNTFFINFANKTKLDIIMALRKGPMNVKDIVKEVKEEQSTVSHNLKKLTECHILTVKRVGKTRVYSLNKDTVIPVLKLAEEHIKKCCCKECDKGCWK